VTAGAAAGHPHCMSVLRSIERKIGGLVEGAFGRTFRSRVQPVELARKLAKEMDDHRTISIHRVYVPNGYTVHLNPDDREQFAAYEQQMTNELEEYLVEHARREGYSVATRPRVLLETEDELGVGLFGISVETADDPAPARESGAGAAVAPPPAPVVTPPIVPAAPIPGPAPIPSAGETMVYAPDPTPVAVDHAVLQWDGKTLELTAATTAIGRSSECAVVLADANVSRRHAEIRRVGDGYSLVDLGSTNGTEVNGQRIAETALMNGDVIGVGQMQLTFERRLG
jgi:Protein of unknown function (DUF3662)/FHA domain